MDLRRCTPFAFLAGTMLCAGCLHSAKVVDVSKAETLPKNDPVANAPNGPIDPVTTQFVAFLKGEGITSTPAKPGQAARLTAGWKHSIAFAPDTQNGGEPVPGLIARVWIFGPEESVPLEPDGELVAAVWDLAAKGEGGKPKLLELWHIDRETAKKFRRRDSIGEGYSLFLPWPSYSVDLKQVNVMLRFNSADGRALTSAPQTLTLDHSATLQCAAEKLGISGKDTGVDFSKVSSAVGASAVK